MRFVKRHRTGWDTSTSHPRLRPSRFGRKLTHRPADTAHMTLRHDRVTGYAHRSLATFLAPRPLDRGNDFTQELEAEVPRPGITSRFFRVPEGAMTLMVDLGWEDREVSLPLDSGHDQDALDRRLAGSRLREKADIEATVDMDASFR